MIGSAAIAACKYWQPLIDALAADMHPDRLRASGIPATAIKRLATNPRACLALSHRLDWLSPVAIAAGLQTENSYRPDAWLEWEEWRTAMPEAGAATLLPGEAIWQGGLRLGTVLFRPEITRLILKSDIAFFKAEVGRDGYFFALRQAGLLRINAALRLAAAGDENDGQIALDQLPEAIVRAAGLGLACWLSGLPEGLAARVMLKLPLAVDAGIAETATWRDEDRQEWRHAMQRILAF